VTAGKGPPPRKAPPGRQAPGARRGPGAPKAPPAPLSARSLARAVLERVETDGAYANRALSAALDRAAALSAEDRALATELVYGVLRRRGRIDRALQAFATGGIDRLDPRALIALRVGAYQILFLDRVPAYAAVDDAVEACKQIAGRGIAGFANALLRRLGRQGEPPLPDPAADPAGHLVAAAGMPAWMADLLLAELPPSEALAFAASIADPAPVTLRANTARVTRDELAARLAAERAGAQLTPSQVAPDALDARRLDAPATTQAWRDGLFAIADAGAQIAVELCGGAAGERILDACAGNGGKTAHLLALAGGRAHVDAIDIAPGKLNAARGTLTRLGLTGATFAEADLTKPLADPMPRYHRILLDAPCSGLGVLRRHPEALARRVPADLQTLAAQQLRMLSAVAPALLPGGLLVYAVCTFERRECEDVVAAFLGAHPRFAIENAVVAGGRVPWERLTDAAGAVRTWPHRDGADGFFAVRLRLAAG
jgi:16S rRNA (cytosine967-C5)-methyltransferase